MSLSLANLIEDGKIQSDPDPKTIEWARQLISLYTDQMSYTAQISKLADIFFDKATDLTDDERKELADDNAKPVIEAFAKKIRALDTFDAYSIGHIVNEVKQETQVKGRKLYMPIRIAATLRMHGPQLAETIELMGRDQVLKNVEIVTSQL